MYGQLCTEFYDADKKFATEEEIDFYKSIFNVSQHILEPMCGSGRLLIPLLQAGFTVDGIDNSKYMLKSCKERALKLGLTPRLFENNIEAINFNNEYDGIIIPFGSFQLFYPRGKAFSMLKKFKRALKPNGKLVMDLFVPWDALWENKEEEKSSREINIDDNTKIKIESNNKANKYEQFIDCHSIYTKWQNEKCIAEEKEHMYITWYYVYEMELILEKYGFKKIEHKGRFLNNEEILTFIAEVGDG
jgi:SAM-dependent methyltransferase